MKNLPKFKLYFQFIMHSNQYIYLSECHKYVENFEILLTNRYKNDIIFLCSNPFNISYAARNGYPTIPITKFTTFIKSDFQLYLVENYIF